MDYMVNMDDLFKTTNLPVDFKVYDEGTQFVSGIPTKVSNDYTLDCTIVEIEDYSSEIKQNNLFSSQYLGIWFSKKLLEKEGLDFKKMKNSTTEYYDVTYRCLGRRDRNNLSSHIELLYSKEGNQ